MLMRPLFTLVAFATLMGCQTMARIEPEKGHGQSLEFAQGNGFLTSTLAKSVVVIAAATTDYAVGPRLAFVVQVENRSSESFDVSNLNISANGNASPIAVIPASQLAKEAASAATWAEFGVALDGAIKEYDAADAGQTTFAGTTSAVVSDSEGSARVTGTFEGTAYDSGAANSAKRQVSQETTDRLATVQSQHQSQLSLISSSMLQRTTLKPGEQTEGFIVIAAPTPRNPQNLIEIVVKVAEDVHRFVFRETQVQ